MKKIALVLGACAAVLLGATGCSKSAKVNTAGWVTSYEAGLKAAEKQNKRVILFFSADEDGTSRTLKDELLETQDFLAELTKKYVLINLDFSASRYEEAMKGMGGEEGLSEKEQKAAEEAQKALTSDLETAMYFSAAASPSFYVLTKEGYPASGLEVTEKTATLADFTALLDDIADDVDYYESLVTDALTKKGVDKAKAIDAVFEETTPDWRYMILPLSRQMEKLDPKNETGVLGKHLLAIANGDASDAFLQQDIEKAAQAFVTVAENNFLTPDQKQEAYYTAAYLLAQGGSTDYAKIRQYAMLSYEAAPESEHAAFVKAFVDQIDQQIDTLEQMQKDVEITADEGYTTVNPSAAPDKKASE